MKTEKPFNGAEMKVYSSLFLDYCILGGMPAVVSEYVRKGTFDGTLDIQRQLLNDYREDICKYAEGMDQTRILNVFEQIPMQLAKDNKKFQISKVAKGARFKDYLVPVEVKATNGTAKSLKTLIKSNSYPEFVRKEEA